MTDGRATPAARLDELTQLYERNAYVVWNVALRTALNDGAADGAARRAFAAQVPHPDEGRLALDAARLAVDAASGIDARGVADPVLAATGHLATVQRAVLALGELTDMPHAEVAAKLGIESEREQQLHDGAYEQLGVLLGTTGADARTAYEDVPWAEPPAELWQTLYPELHATVTQQQQPAAEAAPVAAVRTDLRATRTRGGRRLRGAALAGIAALAVAGVAWAATGGGDGDGSDGGSQGYSGLPASDGDDYASEDGGQDEAGESSTALLTPEELDTLRQEEIEQLKRFQQRKGDQALPRRQRDRAARKVSELVKLAQQRQRAAEQRELALRRQLAQEREARLREQSRREQERDEESTPTAEQEPTQEQQDGGRQQTGGQKSGGGGGSGGGDRDPVETECLYDAENGTYICPE